MQKITPCLWFDDKAEEAATFYVSIFRNAKLGPISRYGEAGAKVSERQKGSVMTVTFEIEGQEFVALNGGPLFKFTEAVSFMVKCESQQKSMRCGACFPTVEKKDPAAGSKTSMVCRGRSLCRNGTRCCETRTPRNRNESWPQSSK